MSRNRNLLFSSLVLSIFLAMAAYISFESIEKEITANELTEQQVYWSSEEEIGLKTLTNIDYSYEACGKGEAQSPIDIEKNNTEQSTETEDVALHYDEASFSLVNDGHTIKAIAETQNNSIIINGEDFRLVEIHFHNPSEHYLKGGSHYEMEAHLVHANKEGEIAVVGLFIENGEMNKVLSDMWSILPEEVTEAYIAVEDPINLVQLLPEELTIFHYMGSLTTSPCTEGVQWYIIEQPIQMSDEQISQFTNIFSNNNRPIQSINNRKVYEMMIEH